MATVMLRDETTAGRDLSSFSLVVPDNITMRDLIRLRVREEVARHNAGDDRSGTPLLGGAHSRHHRTVGRTRRRQRLNWEEEADRAVAGFTTNAYFVLIAGRQVTDLDELISCDDSLSVVFVQLVPLAGG
jgi:hypothetical protein